MSARLLDFIPESPESFIRVARYCDELAAAMDRAGYRRITLADELAGYEEPGEACGE